MTSGKPKSRKSHGTKRMTPALRRKVIHRLEAGETMASIARTIGFSREAVRQLKQRYSQLGEAALRKAFPREGRANLNCNRNTSII